jgi:enoyl-CoA hydratase/carnithine racemase
MRGTGGTGIDTGTTDSLARVRAGAGAGVLTLDRPERRNALSAAIFEGLGGRHPAGG